MASIDDVRKLIEELEFSARNGVGASLTPKLAKLLLQVLRARAAVSEQKKEDDDQALLQVVAFDDNGMRADIIGSSYDPVIATAVFDAAMKRRAGRVRLVQGARVLRERA
jgi:hypothetical protein